MEPQAEKCGQVGGFDLFARGLSPEGQERRARLALNRRQPDTRRRAFLQELAVAVADELELRQAVDAKYDEEYDEAERLESLAEQAVRQAKFEATHPLAALYNKELGRRPDWVPTATYLLSWAIQKGILPTGTEEVPTTAEQFVALASWQLSTKSS